ncbi:MAG: SCO family protein [Bacteroidia bacterium]|nr:SCO family protein [Bacteroidia bacterium]
MGIQESNIVKAFGVRWWIICSILPLVSCTTKEVRVPYYHTPDLSPTWSLDGGDTVHTIESFSFTNQEGKPFGSANLTNSIYVANFFFTSCPSICPKMTSNLTTVATYYEDVEEVKLISFSVTPDIDSVPRLKAYHEGKGLSANWNLLTGNQSDIYRVSRQSFFVEEEIGFNRDSSDFLHTERCILVDQNHQIRGVYNATIALDMDRLVEDIEILRKTN